MGEIGYKDAFELLLYHNKLLFDRWNMAVERNPHHMLSDLYDIIEKFEKKGIKILELSSSQS